MNGRISLEAGTERLKQGKVMQIIEKGFEFERRKATSHSEAAGNAKLWKMSSHSFGLGRSEKQCAAEENVSSIMAHENNAFARAPDQS